ACGSNASAKNASQPRSCRFKTSSFGWIDRKAPCSGAHGEPQECRVLAGATGGSGNGELSHRRTSFRCGTRSGYVKERLGSIPGEVVQRNRLRLLARPPHVDTARPPPASLSAAAPAL